MEIKNALSISDVYQGDLVFIIHKDKPMKTGWWRRLRSNHSNGNNEILLFLEKPMTKDFNPNDPILSESRSVRDIFMMKPSTVEHSDWHQNYELAFVATGLSSVKLVQNNYIPSKELFEDPLFKGSFYTTERGVKLYELWVGTPVSDLEAIAQNLIK